MKVLVSAKRVIDYQVKIRVRKDGSGVETDNVKMSINPFDEIAIEAALQLKEQGHASEVIVASIGDDTCQESLRTALAMGCDRAFLISHAGVAAPMSVARCLAKLAQQESVECVLLGKQAIDSDCNQTGQLLAGILDWPQGTFASAITMQGDAVEVTREVDQGLEVLRLTLPAVMTTDLRLNEPRFASLPNIMKAKSKPLEVVTPDELGVTMTTTVETLTVSPPPKRQAGHQVDSIDEIAALIKQNGWARA